MTGDNDFIRVEQERKLFELATEIEQGRLTHEEAARQLIEYGRQLMKYYPIVPKDEIDEQNQDH